MINLWIARAMCILSVSVLCFTGCTKVDVVHLPGSADEGYVIIRPDQSAHSLPGHAYYFYRSDMVSPCITLNCDGKGNFAGKLPMGSYRVIATNTGATGVEFRDMYSYETASVHAVHLSNHPYTRASVNNSRLGEVYSTVIEELVVTANDTIRHAPAPVLLTKTMTLTFTPKDKLVDLLTGMEGSLQGVYPSVHLFSQCTSEEEIGKSPGKGVSFIASPDNSSATWSASIDLFGLCDPKHGEVYRNILSLTLAVDGGQQTIEVDLSNELSDLIAGNNGDIPVNLPLEVELNWDDDGIEVIGTVKPWEKGGEEEVEINKPKK